MPKLCDIVKPGVSCRVRSEGATFVWNGARLVPDIDEHVRVSDKHLLFSHDWHLDEPTFEGVLRDRGREANLRDGLFVIEPIVQSLPKFTVSEKKRPTTVAQIIAICDLLDQYK